jgi:arylsulfatase A-like enzyme
VPLIVRFPGERGAALNRRRVRAIAQLVDVAPTLLDFVGLPIPGHVQGRSLLPVLESGESGNQVVLSDWERGRVRSLRAGDWKLVRRAGRVELYNLAEDPRETHDLAAREPQRLAELRDAMAGLIRASQEIRDGMGRGEEVTPDDETLEELRALGYID